MAPAGISRGESAGLGDAAPSGDEAALAAAGVAEAEAAESGARSAAMLVLSSAIQRVAAVAVCFMDIVGVRLTLFRGC